MIPNDEPFQINKDIRPYTHLNFKNDPDDFQFAIITDNAGGARPGVFSKAVEIANLLQPEFVINAGDLIEGYSEDEEQLRLWWQEIDEILEQLEMPFFFLPGNHDILPATAIKIWRERFGSEQAYYHFVYKNVLFLMVNTEDPPKSVEVLQRENPGLYKQVLEAKPDIRWNLVVTHSPPHHSPAIGEKDPGKFPQIEALLADRSYTVFSAHTHTYHYEQRDGRDYITTATSGAMNVVRPGAMDHLVWVTMTDQGLKIVNLLMNGILDKKGPLKDDDLAEIGLYRTKT